MKIACEKCNEIMEYDRRIERYREIDIGTKKIILCEECFKKFKNWLYNKEVGK